MKREMLTVRSQLRDYTVEFPEHGDWVAALAHEANLFVVVDENVWRCHGSGCLAPLAARDPLLLPSREEDKTFSSVFGLFDRLVELPTKRNTVLVSVGGGITQDVTGFVASTIYRGVRWVYVPTTLLAQADSCIGGKTSLNYGHYKNLVGTVFPPERVIVHGPFLDTLDDEYFASGVGEVVKLHVLGGQAAAARVAADLADVLARRPEATAAAVLACLQIKRGFIEEDELDRGRRNLLNFGHCFGHAIESATDFAVPHGQAVVLGMLLAGVVAQRRGLLSESLATHLAERLYLPALAVHLDLTDPERRRVVDAMRHDKKRTGAGLALVMMCDGWLATQVADLGEGEALAALAELSRW